MGRLVGHGSAPSSTAGKLLLTACRSATPGCPPRPLHSRRKSGRITVIPVQASPSTTLPSWGSGVLRIPPEDVVHAVRVAARGDAPLGTPAHHPASCRARRQRRTAGTDGPASVAVVRDVRSRPSEQQGGSRWLPGTHTCPAPTTPPGRT